MHSVLLIVEQRKTSTRDEVLRWQGFSAIQNVVQVDAVLQSGSGRALAEPVISQARLCGRGSSI